MRVSRAYAARLHMKERVHMELNAGAAYTWLLGFVDSPDGPCRARRGF